MDTDAIRRALEKYSAEHGACNRYTSCICGDELREAVAAALPAADAVQRLVAALVERGWISTDRDDDRDRIGGADVCPACKVDHPWGYGPTFTSPANHEPDCPLMALLPVSK